MRYKIFYFQKKKLFNLYLKFKNFACLPLYPLQVLIINKLQNTFTLAKLLNRQQKTPKLVLRGLKIILKNQSMLCDGKVNSL